METPNYWYNWGKNIDIDELPKKLWSYVKGLAQNQHTFTLATRQKYAYLYEPSNTYTYNIVRQSIDAIGNRISSVKTKPFFLTTDGDESIKRRAKAKSDFMVSIFNNTKFFTTAQKVFRDAQIYGTGFLYPHIADDKIKYQAVNPQDVLIDSDEEMADDIRSIFWVKDVARSTMYDDYPKLGEKIKEASSFIDNTILADNIGLVECWHYNKKGKGRHIIFMSNAIIKDEVYEKTYLPFVKFDWSPSTKGFWGRGIAEELESIQDQIDFLMRKQRDEMDLAGLKCFVPMGSVQIKSITNQIGAIIEYAGQVPPTFVNQSVVASDCQQQIKELKSEALRIIGIGDMMASGKKPVDIESAKALSEMRDTETIRFSVIENRYDEMVIEATKYTIALLEDLPNLAIFNGKYGKQLYKDVSLPENEYAVQVYATNLLPATPTGKLQALQTLVDMGIFSSAEATYFLGVCPDVESIAKLKNAPITLINNHIEEILDKGIPHTCLPEMNAQEVINLGMLHLNKAWSEGVDEIRVGLLLNYIESAKAILAMAQPTPEQAMPPLPTQQQ